MKSFIPIFTTLALMTSVLATPEPKKMATELLSIDTPPSRKEAEMASVMLPSVGQNLRSSLRSGSDDMMVDRQVASRGSNHKGIGNVGSDKKSLSKNGGKHRGSSKKSKKNKKGKIAHKSSGRRNPLFKSVLAHPDEFSGVLTKVQIQKVHDLKGEKALLTWYKNDIHERKMILKAGLARLETEKEMNLKDRKTLLKELKAEKKGLKKDKKRAKALEKDVRRKSKKLEKEVEDRVGMDAHGDLEGVTDDLPKHNKSAWTLPYPDPVSLRTKKSMHHTKHRDSGI